MICQILMGYFTNFTSAMLRSQELHPPTIQRWDPQHAAPALRAGAARRRRHSRAPGGEGCRISWISPGKMEDFSPKWIQLDGLQWKMPLKWMIWIDLGVPPVQETPKSVDFTWLNMKTSLGQNQTHFTLALHQSFCLLTTSGGPGSHTLRCDLCRNRADWFVLQHFECSWKLRCSVLAEETQIA